MKTGPLRSTASCATSAGYEFIAVHPHRRTTYEDGIIGSEVTARSVKSTWLGQVPHRRLRRSVRRDVGEVFMQLLDVSSPTGPASPRASTSTPPPAEQPWRWIRRRRVRLRPLRPRYLRRQRHQAPPRGAGRFDTRSGFGNDKCDGLPRFCITATCASPTAPAAQARLRPVAAGSAGLDYLCPG